MTVCQGCGRTCNTDLCCPTCASLTRSSFFCSQECFAGNWKEHCKLHAIIKQQMRMAELDDRERKMRGLSAASNAFSAISEIFRAPTPDRVSVATTQSKPSTEDSETPETFKDHQVRPIDRLIGPNGLLRGFRIILLLTAVIFVVFVKVNTLISEIPVAVEKRTVIKVSEALGVQNSVAGRASATTSVSKAAVSGEQKPQPPVESDAFKGIVDTRTDDVSTNSLKNEIEKLRKQVEQYKGLYEAAGTNATNVTEVSHEIFSDMSNNTVIDLPEKEAKQEEELVGVVRDEEPRRLREIGAVQSQ